MRGCVPERVGSRPSHRAGNGQKKFFLNKKNSTKVEHFPLLVRVHTCIYYSSSNVPLCVNHSPAAPRTTGSRLSLSPLKSRTQRVTSSTLYYFRTLCTASSFGTHTLLFFENYYYYIFFDFFFLLFFVFFFLGGVFLRMNSKIINFALLFYWLFSPDIVSNENI